MLLGIGGLVAQEPPEVPVLPETTVVGEMLAAESGAGPTSPLMTRPVGIPLLVPINQSLTTPGILPVGIENVIGGPTAASQGRVTPDQIQYQVRSRVGEVLQEVPGLIVTQHSGTGKANQFFLRGFNLDHGTDFSVWIDDVPINLPTHAHGQGYLDVNWLIPELVQYIDFYKGPYYAQLGDFSSVGSAWMYYANSLDAGFTRFEFGRTDYFRLLNADFGQVGPGVLMYAVEGVYYNGPWVTPEDFQKINLVFRYTIGDSDEGLSLSLLGYNAKWRATDQIPLRAVREGRLDFFGAVDPSDGGGTSRGQANLQWWRLGDNGALTKANVYGVLYSLNLYSNFTYVLDDEINGDQFGQIDRRFYTGANVTHSWNDWIIGNRLRHTVGFQARNDYIPRLELTKTKERQLLGITRSDEVNEFNIGLFYYNEVQWLDKVRTQLGVRGDPFSFWVDSKSLPENSGSRGAAIVNPKASLIVGPWAWTDFYLNAGMSYHSNDARGVTIKIDPVTGEPIEPSPPLVRTRGWETGFRTQAIPNLMTTLTYWYLELDSELVFLGDAGTTEAARPSRRYGLEFNNNYLLNRWLRIDAYYAWSHARFTEFAPEGQFIPGAIETAFFGGPTFLLPNGMFITAQYRYFGPRPLNEAGSVYSDSTSVVNLEIGYRRPRLNCGVMFLNLLDSRDHDIDYFYTSRLPGEPREGVDDIHFHPLEPFAARFYCQLNY